MTTSKPPVQQATYVRESRPGKVWLTEAKKELLVAGAKAESFLWVPGINTVGQTVVSAKLRLYASETAASGLHVAAHVAKPYNTMTWNNKPGNIAGAVVANLTEVATNVWEAEIGPLITAAGGKVAGLRVYADSTSGAWRKFFGVQSSKPPLVTVETSVAPPTPAQLAPHGVVSLGTFVAQWPAVDSQTDYQVQVSAVDAGFAAPLWDSGWRAGTLGQANLGTLGWTGQAVGGSVDWRVRTRNTEGTSGWSDPATVTRLAKVAVTWGALEPGNPVPTRSWTVTGGTQTAFDLSASYASGSSSMRGGTGTSAEPAGGPSSDGEQVTDRLRIWGDKGHVDAINDPAYVEITRTWTLDLSGDGATADAVRVEQVGVTPDVLIQIQEAEPGNGWLVTRHREFAATSEIVARFDASENLVAPGMWSLVDETCAPNQDTTYRVQKILTSGILGAPITYTVHPEVTGVWVRDIGTGEQFSLGGLDVSAAARHMVTTTTTLVGEEIDFTTGLGGLSVTCRGILQDHGGVLTEEMLEHARAMMSTPDRDRRLVWGGNNILGRVRKIDPSTNLEFSTTRRLAWDVAFEFAEAAR